PGGTACRAIISIGVATGTNDMNVANELFGSRTTGPRANSGTQATSTTGSSSICVSFMSVQAAPTATNSEPYISTASVWKTRNQAIRESGMDAVTPRLEAAQ